MLLVYMSMHRLKALDLHKPMSVVGLDKMLMAGKQSA